MLHTDTSYCFFCYQLDTFPSLKNRVQREWLKPSAMLHHGKMHLVPLSFGKGALFEDPVSVRALPHPDSWPLTLMVGTSLYKALLSAQNKISLHFQLIWQTPWVTNAYHCHRLVKDFINGVFFQVQPQETSWGFIPLSVNTGICRPNGHQGAKQYFFSPIQTPPPPRDS